jgi:hypothetical protein
MKRLILILIVCLGLLSCGIGSLTFQNGRGDAIAEEIGLTCTEGPFKYKSEVEVASLTARQLVDEEVSSQLAFASFDSYSAWSNYGSLISKYVRKDGTRVLPVLTEYMNGYDPKTASKCEETRFAVSTRLAADLDRFEFRLRGTKEGQLAIAALDHAVELMRRVGYDRGDSEYENNREFRLYSLQLKELKGINEVDRAIRDTFWIRWKKKISDYELSDFSNFLVSRDPGYPSWSTSSLIKDQSRINEAGNPLQVYTLNEPDRYYQAYLDFKKIDRR